MLENLRLSDIFYTFAAQIDIATDYDNRNDTPLGLDSILCGSIHHAAHRPEIIRKEGTARGKRQRGPEDDRRMDWRVAAVLSGDIPLLSWRLA